MLLELTRCVADALASGDIGVNVTLPLVPLDATDLAPSPVAIITDETRNLSSALRLEDTIEGQYPLINVYVGASVSHDASVVYGLYEADVPIVISYISRALETDEQVRDGYYTMRAILKTLHLFHDNANAHLRTRNGVQVVACQSIEQLPTNTSKDSTHVEHAFIVTYKVKNTTP